MFLQVRLVSRQRRVDAPFRQEAVHVFVGLKAHPVVPAGDIGKDVRCAQIASVAGFPVAVGQVYRLQYEWLVGQDRVGELDGDLPDAGLADQPVHADLLCDAVRDGNGDGPAAGHHEPAGRIVPQGGFRPGQGAQFRIGGRLEGRRGIDHGEGGVIARGQLLLDGRSGIRGSGFGQPAVLVQQERPVVDRPFSFRPGHAGLLSEDGEDDLDGLLVLAGRRVAARQEETDKQGCESGFHSGIRG